jgi:Tfp pilus assembly protein PilF
MPRAIRLLCCISCCVLAIAVAGCASQQASSRPEEPAQQATDANSHLMVAEIALQRGEYNAAAKEYVAAAKLASDPTLAQRATAVAFEK